MYETIEIWPKIWFSNFDFDTPLEHCALYEVSFALKFWVADHLQTKTSDWKLPVWFNLSTSVYDYLESEGEWKSQAHLQFQ